MSEDTIDTKDFSGDAIERSRIVEVLKCGVPRANALLRRGWVYLGHSTEAFSAQHKRAKDGSLPSPAHYVAHSGSPRRVRATSNERRDV